MNLTLHHSNESGQDDLHGKIEGYSMCYFPHDLTEDQDRMNDGNHI